MIKLVISTQCFIIASIFLYLVLYVTCKYNKFNKFSYILVNIIVLFFSLIYGSFGFFQNSQALLFLEIELTDDIVFFSFIIWFFYMYIFARILPSRRNY